MTTVPAAGFGARVKRSLSLPDWIYAYLFLAPAAAVFFVLITYPVIDGIKTAFTNRAIAQAGEFTGLDNFVYLFGNADYWRALLNSLVLTAGTVAAKLALGLLSAVILTQPMPMRGLVRALAFLPWAVPGLIAALSWKWIYDEQAGVLTYLALKLGIVDQPVYWLSDPSVAMFSIAIAMIWQGLPFYTMMLIAALSSLPKEVVEAAHVDGAGGFRRFFEITLPQIKEVIIVTVMLSSIWTFNSFEKVYILTGGGPANRTQILPTLAYEYGIMQSQLGLGAATIVSVIPVFAVLIVILTRRMLTTKLNA